MARDPGDRANGPGAWPNLDERSDVPKRTYTPEQYEKQLARVARWRANNLERARAQEKVRRERWLAKPGVREKRAAVARARYAANPEARVKQVARRHAWMVTPGGREIIRAHAANARAHAAGSPVIDLTEAEWVSVLEEFGGCCAYCGTTERVEQDHVRPLKRGGSHTRDNVAPACRSCNASKGNKTLAEWHGFVTR